MEFLQGPWPFIIVLFAFVLVFIGVNFYVCRQYTGTWNGLKYLFDHKYWCFAVMNHEYLESLKRNETVETFIIHFSKHKVMPRKKLGIFKLSEDERKIWVMLLSQQDFIMENFGQKPYSRVLHKEM